MSVINKYTLSNKDTKLIEQIFGFTEDQLLVTMSKVLHHYYKKVKTTNDYIYALGDIPIALVAHLDTVHAIEPYEIYHDSKQKVLWSPQGLGADDRAGVFAIVKLIERGYRPSIILCTKEEVGGKGAAALIKDYPNPAVKTNFLVEMDRQGQNDSVYYSFENQKFEDYINSYGFVSKFGTYSDVETIGPAWKVPFTNLSIGYYNEHTKSELLCYEYMYSTIDKVAEMLDAEKTADHLFEFKVFDYWARWAYENSIYEIDNYSGKKKQICDCCGEIYPEEQMLEVKDYSTQFYFCPGCVGSTVSWCEDCNTAFIDWGVGLKKCRKCRGDDDYE